MAESQDVGPVMSPTRWNRKADAANMLVLNYPVNSGSGIKLGQAITMSAFLIQGPFTKEDKADIAGQPGAQASGPVSNAQRVL